MAVISRKEITVPNIMTLLRIIMAVMAAFLIRVPGRAGLAAWMLIFASILDYFDGWYARKFHQKTRLGAHLDPFADKVLVTVVFLIIATTIKTTWFYFFVGVILLREILVTVYRIVVRRNAGVFVPASWLGKIKTTVQCLVGDGMLFYLFIFPAKIPEKYWVIFVLMLLTAAITVDSGLGYVLPKCSDGKNRSIIERILQWLPGSRAREA
jgi:CDP-diacylglycerol--glycerol-3-phosphate 3-phosphatidyltransferase